MEKLEDKTKYDYRYKLKMRDQLFLMLRHFDREYLSKDDLEKKHKELKEKCRWLSTTSPAHTDDLVDYYREDAKTIVAVYPKMDAIFTLNEDKNPDGYNIEMEGHEGWDERLKKGITTRDDEIEDLYKTFIDYEKLTLSEAEMDEQIALLELWDEYSFTLHHGLLFGESVELDYFMTDKDIKVFYKEKNELFILDRNEKPKIYVREWLEILGDSFDDENYFKGRKGIKTKEEIEMIGVTNLFEDGNLFKESYLYLKETATCKGYAEDFRGIHAECYLKNDKIYTVFLYRSLINIIDNFKHPKEYADYFNAVLKNNKPCEYNLPIGDFFNISPLQPEFDPM